MTNMLNPAGDGFPSPSEDVMTRAVTAFNVMAGKNLEVSEAYHFLSVLNMVMGINAPQAPAPKQEAQKISSSAPEATSEKAELAPEAPAIPGTAPAAPKSIATAPTSAPVMPVEGAKETAIADVAKAGAVEVLEVAPEVAPAPEVDPKAEPKPAEEPDLERMPNVEELSDPPSPMALLRTVPPVIKSKNFDWMPEYRWRITVVPFDDARRDLSYAVHFRERPTQEQFDEHYALFARSDNRCKVHIMESDGRYTSHRITDEYCTFREKSEDNAFCSERMTPRPYFEGEERYRIRFYDRRISSFNYIYYSNKPTDATLKRISRSKGGAILQARGEGGA
ncbi:hypothetical protein [Nissabacter sp. SGAir0207]|uniref:hypothetical protein n=1 Tax=Nissabacter sp. SGAir0207 TaxID=2126321 RepID=UPI0010F54EE5|nr:hypothetical protein [Nissabacter sp. SGAir0207]